METKIVACLSQCRTLASLSYSSELLTEPACVENKDFKQNQMIVEVKLSYTRFLASYDIISQHRSEESHVFANM